MKLRKLIFFAVTALMLSSFQCLYAHDVPFPLPSDKINEYPFNMVGMVSAGGPDKDGRRYAGSGTAISQKVVLSALHVVYDKDSLKFKFPFEWSLQHSPTNSDFNLKTRSYNWFSDYADATKKYDPGDGRSSYEQLNLDIVTLIFYEDVAKGSWAGWHNWDSSYITDTTKKMIVGYPDLGYSDNDFDKRHTMHSTSLSGSYARFSLENYNDRLGFASRLYTTYDLSTGPGNSGGPVFSPIEFDTGVDWGITGIVVSGEVNEFATVVAIDEHVYDLIYGSISNIDSTPIDDHGDSRSEATAIQLNQTVSGDLEREGDIDYFRFAITKQGTLTTFTTGNTDTFGTLRNSQGNFIVSNDDSGQRENFSIKRSLTPGTYYILISHALSQGTGTYSLRVNFVEKITYPDLAVDSVRVNKTSVKSGDTVQVTLRRSNKGDKNSATFNHGIYLSRDRTITTSDRSLANLRATSMITGASSTSSQEVTIPKNTTPGTYYIGYIVDTNNGVSETSEANNTGYTAITVTRPALDLVLAGSGDIVGQDIRHPSGNVFDQVLLTSQHIKLKARPGRITRASFMDHNLDIVQVEFSGAGTFTINLDPATFVSARFPPLYNQQVKYVTGTASIIIEGAGASTFFSVFTVGRINAVNQALFPLGQRYDAQADIKLVEVINSVGFGGMQLANTVFSGSTGKVGVDARDVPIAVRLTIGDIDASGDATPYLLFSKGSFTTRANNSGLRITGGDLLQSNGASIVAISEARDLTSQDNYKSDGTWLSRKEIRETFDFIDKPDEIYQRGYALNSLLGKTYEFDGFAYSTGELSLTFTFNNDTSGKFKMISERYEIDNIDYHFTHTGRFNYRVDSRDPNKAYLTLDIVTISVDSLGITLLNDGVETVADEFGIELSKSMEIELTFFNSVSGKFYSTSTLTDNSLYEDSGKFKEL